MGEGDKQNTNQNVHVTVNNGRNDVGDNVFGCLAALLLALILTLVSTGIEHPGFGIPALIAVVAAVGYLFRKRWEQKRQRAAQAALVSRRNARRRELEGLATVGPTGICGFCGALEQHRDGYGKPYYPLEWHRQDIDRIVADLT